MKVGDKHLRLVFTSYSIVTIGHPSFAHVQPSSSDIKDRTANELAKQGCARNLVIGDCHEVLEIAKQPLGFVIDR